MIPPVPVIFEPILKRKPWGGRRLESILGKSLPPGEQIGESWELVSLPPPSGAALHDYESRVRNGPLAGRTLSQLIELWGTGLHGSAELVDGRFPLLIKFLDARENLSVQVHPKPAQTGDATGEVRPPIKHEAWYVIDAAPGSELLIGLKPEVTPEQLARQAHTAAVVDLLRHRPAKPSACYYLPSGTPHALGAGVLVAEIQTPSDITYRMYDWERTDAAGQPRELHVQKALENIAWNVPEELIRQPRRHVGGVLFAATRLVFTDRFTIEKIRASEAMSDDVSYGEMAIWVILRGRGMLRTGTFECPFQTGDVVLIPAGAKKTQVMTEVDSEWLEVKVPVASSLAGFAHPQAEAPAGRGDGTVKLTVSMRGRSGDNRGPAA